MVAELRRVSRWARMLRLAVHEMFDWRDFFRLASELARPEDADPLREARLRAAIGRAYYASHWVAREFLIEIAGDEFAERLTGSGLDHLTVIEELQSSAQTRLRRAGIELDRLRRARTRADYDASSPVLADATERALAQANRVLTACSAEL